MKDINQQPKPDDFLIDDSVNSSPIKKDDSKVIDPKKIKRKRFIKKVLISVLVCTSISLMLFFFALAWQDDFTSLMAIGDALWLVFALWLTLAWMLSVYNLNILSPLIHGTKTFVLMIVGKRPKEDYYTYTQKVKQNQIPKYYLIVCWITTLIIFIVALITLILLKK